MDNFIENMLNLLENDSKNYRLCSRCLEIKRTDLFYRSTLNNKNAATWCTECLKKYNKAYNQTYKRKKYHSNYQREKQRYYKYGINNEKFAQILFEQENKCAICGTQNPGKENWCLDHCHETHIVRGILCKKCNSSIGLIKDNLDALNKAYIYLLKYQDTSYNPYIAADILEVEIAKYCKSKYAVCTYSCTSSIYLCLMYEKIMNKTHIETVNIPKFTYVSVPNHIIHAGYKVEFREENWSGIYKLEPFNIYDSARRFTRGMYITGSLMCLSFHPTKIFSLSRGGCILTDDYAAYKWLKMARYDGRTPYTDVNKDILQIGWRCGIDPSVAFQGLLLLPNVKNNNPDLPNSDYPDLSKMDVFK